ncbi:MAG: NUDIX hydrolase [Proteobacteria bacterium]|nr:MAG: NUDIX hydrolase [Pseudomonadota bacterium]PIE19004.1 MAG: NUDIX hydrolase [Pseudomonadota bacterium]
MRYRNPIPVVDVIIEHGECVVLIERRDPPHGWALPGGHVDEGESLSLAAIREAKEETGLTVELDQQFFCYSEPTRDPRKHTVSTVFIGRASGVPIAGDDAAAVGLFRRGELPPLVFDHAQILADFFHYRDTGERPPASR